MSIDFEEYRWRLHNERRRNGGYWYACGREVGRYPRRPVYRWRWL